VRDLITQGTTQGTTLQKKGSIHTHALKSKFLLNSNKPQHLRNLQNRAILRQIVSSPSLVEWKVLPLLKNPKFPSTQLRSSFHLASLFFKKFQKKGFDVTIYLELSKEKREINFPILCTQFLQSCF